MTDDQLKEHVHAGIWFFREFSVLIDTIRHDYINMRWNADKYPA